MAGVGNVQPISKLCIWKFQWELFQFLFDNVPEHRNLFRFLGNLVWDFPTCLWFPLWASEKLRLSGNTFWDFPICLWFPFQNSEKFWFSEKFLFKLYFFSKSRKFSDSFFHSSLGKISINGDFDFQRIYCIIIYWCTYLSVQLSNFLTVCVPLHHPVCFCLSVYLSICRSICCLPVYKSIHPFIDLFFLLGAYCNKRPLFITVTTQFSGSSLSLKFLSVVSKHSLTIRFPVFLLFVIILVYISTCPIICSSLSLPTCL